MPFPSTLTTRALYPCSLRRFGTCSCKPVPRGLPSSLVQPRGALTPTTKRFHKESNLRITIRNRDNVWALRSPLHPQVMSCWHRMLLIASPQSLHFFLREHVHKLNKSLISLLRIERKLSMRRQHRPPA